MNTSLSEKQSMSSTSLSEKQSMTTSRCGRKPVKFDDASNKTKKRRVSDLLESRSSNVNPMIEIQLLFAARN